MSSLALVDGLQNYSERGQAYVDTLKGIIQVNSLDIADGAVFRKEPIRFVLGAAGPAEAVKLHEDISAMRKSGELENIIQRMRLD